MDKIIKFNAKELNYIKEVMEDNLKYYNSPDEKESKEINRSLENSSIETMILISKDDYKLLKKVNKDKEINERVKSYIEDALDFWVWTGQQATGEEVRYYINHDEFVSIYSKIYEDDEE